MTMPERSAPLAVAALTLITLTAAALAEPQSPQAPQGAAGTHVFPAAPQRDLVVRACAACHAPEMVIAKRHTADEWEDIIAKMVDRGAVANDEEQQQILEYLVKFFGPA